MCEIRNGEMYSVNVPRTWIEEQILDGTLVSGETTLTIPKGSVVNDDHGEIEMAGTPMLSNARDGSNRRQLSKAVEGDVSVLIVRVIASNGSTSSSIQDLTNSILGNDPKNPDPVTLRSQYSGCSHGKLNIVEARDRDGETAQIRGGGTTISVSVSTDDGDTKMRNAITQELNSQFGVDRPDELAMHVMYCLPPDTMEGLAYAFINSWNSVYDDKWCMKVSAQVHEIGHNLGLSHSNENGESYKDQSGMVSLVDLVFYFTFFVLIPCTYSINFLFRTLQMGYSYNKDNSPKMCFNAAKSWQLGWYTKRHATVDISNPSYIGKLASIVDDPDEIGHPMLIKLVSLDGNDCYINFNLKAGVNAETEEGGNQVLVTEAGSGYSDSDLKAKLDAGESYDIANFDGKGNVLSVEVVSISVFDKVADVRICLGDCVNGITSSPTRALVPTPSPTLQLSNSPTSRPSRNRSSDAPTKFPSRTPTMSPTLQLSNSPASRPTRSSDAPTKFPSRTPTMSPTLQLSNFPTPRPTRSSDAPTKFPSRTPTMSPTLQLSKSPTSRPNRSSDAPTKFPPRTPTMSPTGGKDDNTEIPTNGPTRIPPNMSPTKNPVNESCKNSNPELCEWVKKDILRCALHLSEDPQKHMGDLCPSTCDVNCNCHDVDSYFDYYGRSRSCDWVSREGHCWWSNEARSNCPATCGVCVGDNPETPSQPTSSPVTSPIFCHDEVKRIPILNHSTPRYCSWFEDDLSRCSLRSAENPSKLLSAYCPVTCRLDCQCYDVEYFYYRFNGDTRTVNCEWVASKGLCGNSKARSYCPITCGVC
jgi:hypothetical protein